MAAPPLLDIFRKGGQSIGSSPITTEARIAYSAKYEGSDALQTLLYDCILKDKYRESDIRISRQRIINEAKKPEYSKLSPSSKLLIAENNIIKKQIIDSVKSIVKISDENAYNHAKGLLQIRNGEKAFIKCSDLDIKFEEKEMQEYYNANKLKFKSDRVVNGVALIIDSQKLPREKFESLIENGNDIADIKKEYNAKIAKISWINKSSTNKQYPFLEQEQTEDQKFYSTSDGNTIYLKINDRKPSHYLTKYEDAKKEVRIDLLKKYIVNHANQIKANWTQLEEQNIKQNDQDNMTLFLTKKGNVNCYEKENGVVLIKTNEIKNFEPTDQQILDSKSFLRNYFQYLAVNSFTNALFKHYENDIYSFINELQRK
ncbi:hypothetical protein FZC35_00550 [Candidatus Cytomitobacter indipagum]|uniref:Uncharacterized protein n=1 Tax=Candidatus Cytomitobacter indipagum TaxID=2601575 RepID=A0A5C0UCY2_9PROT|nr:hypothetical protein [Candidatus Cytomitobacter indipagum]QEK37875.1 hypothetical protein FZC35_00550 [Candidatus Cytomitobacter indipagum]